MGLLNKAVVDGVLVVARQVVDTTASTASTVLSNTLSQTSTSITTTSSTASLPTPTTTGATIANGPTTTPTAGPGSNNNNNSGGGSNSSPLLFFVALGFGVVFTNLWIIVGVKYCFRYNARSRQMRMDENGEPINMDNMPRPHRRRREKKLMTMDEVNEKFPMMKYKSWVASRAQEGLPTRGGVSAPPSRPGSLRDVDGVAPELPSKERSSTEERPTTSATGAVTEKQLPSHAPKQSTSSTTPAPPRASSDGRLVPTVSESATLSKDINRASQDDEDEDDEHINAALPPECMGTSGDTCAICIDTLEDDDDVRGLTCGHAFHAACLDPWLTSRRACCPLCKADYYTPKPRPPPVEGADTGSPAVITVTLPSDRSSRMNMPTRPRPFYSLVRTGRSNRSNDHDLSITQSTGRPSNTDSGRPGFFGRFRGSSPAPRERTQQAVPTSPTYNTPPQPGMLASFRNAFPAFRMGAAQRRAQGPVASGANPAVTPSSLEAGVRS